MMMLQLPSKRRKRSEVWLGFDTFTRNSLELAKCKYCGSELTASHVSGTSHLKKYLAKCMEKYGIMMNVSEEQHFVFDQEKSINDFATVVIKHNYCFNMAEHTFFEIFCKELNPNFKLMSRNTLSISSRISLTTDIWAARHQGMGYVCITAHFVDDDWVFKKKIICFQHIEYPHDGPALSKVLRDSILDWNIDRKLFSLVVDNASANDWMVKDLKLCAHILNLIVSDGLEIIKDTIIRTKRSVRYLTHSNYGKQKFENAKKHCKLENKKKVLSDVSM
uniref:BED-type domain-containing protein n=1 Tax=Kalanchoe fedtschenkoi TaxID=63787 RepID=A0A7N0VJ98_KALFE